MRAMVLNKLRTLLEWSELPIANLRRGKFVSR
jgi:hypothetical protein